MKTTIVFSMAHMNETQTFIGFYKLCLKNKKIHSSLPNIFFLSFNFFKILCSRIILLGDLNYRISMPESETRTLVEQKEWDLLLKKDQVNTQTFAKTLIHPYLVVC